MYAADFRKIARDSLRGRWATAVLATLVAGFLGGTSSSGGVSLDLNLDESTLKQWENVLGSEVMMEYLIKILQVLIPFVAIASILAIVVFVIGGVISLGYSLFVLNVVDGKDARFGDVFSQFYRFGDGFCLRLLTGLFVALWSMLFVIPGIIAMYSYAMAPFIMLENPNCGARQALAESKEMMRGNRWRLFCLEISFLGWSILNLFTLGIGSLWLNPYVEVSRAAFYREISGTSFVQEAPQVTLEY